VHLGNFFFCRITIQGSYEVKSLNYLLVLGVFSIIFQLSVHFTLNYVVNLFHGIEYFMYVKTLNVERTLKGFLLRKCSNVNV
jgi:hypothetical protein